MTAQHALLHRDGEPDLLRFTTAGSVDDGKSTLIGRLLHDADALYEDHVEALEEAPPGGRGDEIDFSLITDGLKAEREQGITIDVAYRYFATPSGASSSPTRPATSSTRATWPPAPRPPTSPSILIDARLGVLTQIQRHAFISSLLGMPRLVVAVNKMDLVGYDRDVFERIKDEYTDFATRLGFGDLTFIPVSALRGDNVVAAEPPHAVVRRHAAADASGERLRRRRPEPDRFPLSGAARGAARPELPGLQRADRVGRGARRATRSSCSPRASARGSRASSPTTAISPTPSRRSA